MIYNEITAKIIANQLLEIEAVKISIDNPFTWTSGIKSPVYCDNRITLSDFNARDLIKHSFIKCIKDKFIGVECIAGVATAGIPQATLIADYLNLPLIYVRNKPKGHGLGNQIEGKLIKNQRVLVIEDLVSTGKSSLEAVDAIRNAGGNVMGLLAIFTYGFEKTNRLFKEKDVDLWTLSDYQTLKFFNGSLPEELAI